MDKLKIYHNPRCSKSRKTLALLEEAGVDVEVVEYLKAPPDTKTLRGLLGKLGVGPRAILRTAEPAYGEAGLTPKSTDEEILEAIGRFPSLLQRPIVVRGENAIIGRPPENVLDLL